ncbi:hypothetical protein NWP22_04020, partial [Anabaenopsis tanganyikae CS-531]
LRAVKGDSEALLQADRSDGIWEGVQDPGLVSQIFNKSLGYGRSRGSGRGARSPTSLPNI